AVIKTRPVCLVRTGTARDASTCYEGLTVFPCHSTQETIESKPYMLVVLLRANKSGHHITVFVHMRLNVNLEAVVYRLQPWPWIPDLRLESYHQPIVNVWHSSLPLIESSVAINSWCLK